MILENLSWKYIKTLWRRKKCSVLSPKQVTTSQNCFFFVSSASLWVRNKFYFPWQNVCNNWDEIIDLKYFKCNRNILVILSRMWIRLHYYGKSGKESRAINELTTNGTVKILLKPMMDHENNFTSSSFRFREMHLHRLFFPVRIPSLVPFPLPFSAGLENWTREGYS